MMWRMDRPSRQPSRVQRQAICGFAGGASPAFVGSFSNDTTTVLIWSAIGLFGGNIFVGMHWRRRSTPSCFIVRNGNQMLDSYQELLDWYQDQRPTDDEVHAAIAHNQRLEAAAEIADLVDET